MDLGLGQESSGPSGESEYSLSSSPLTRARYRQWSDPRHIKQPRDKGWAARKDGVPSGLSSLKTLRFHFLIYETDPLRSVITANPRRKGNTVMCSAGQFPCTNIVSEAASKLQQTASQTHERPAGESNPYREC